VIPAAFDYAAPTTIDEALAALAEAGDEAKVLGRWPVAAADPAHAAQQPVMLIDLGRIDEPCAASARTATRSSSAR
jgi:carbon-monoxide dehydrogenase medium subunit